MKNLSNNEGAFTVNAYRSTSPAPSTCKCKSNRGGLIKNVLVLLFGMALTAQGSLSRLEAISMIETGNNDFVRGNAGEVSRYQLMPKIWSSYTSSKAYADPRVSTPIARQHLMYLESWFQSQTGRAPTEFDLYVLWNAGTTYYARKSFRATAVSPVIRERACRFVNLRTGVQEAHFVDEPPPPSGTRRL